jgi:uncharacterized protein (UPF0297 family)
MIPDKSQVAAATGNDGGTPRVNNETARFEMPKDDSNSVKGIMTEVLHALMEKGYNPVNQLVGYFLSGDPTYITNHMGARGVIRRMERDELLEVIIQEYVKTL